MRDVPSFGWRLCFGLAAILLLMGGGQHPNGTMAEMLAHPAWVQSHLFMLAGFVALFVGLILLPRTVGVAGTDAPVDPLCRDRNGAPGPRIGISYGRRGRSRQPDGRSPDAGPDDASLAHSPFLSAVCGHVRRLRHRRDARRRAGIPVDCLARSRGGCGARRCRNPGGGARHRGSRVPISSPHPVRDLVVDRRSLASTNRGSPNLGVTVAAGAPGRDNERP